MRIHPYAHLQQRLEHVLRMRFSWDSPDSRTPIGKALTDVLLHHAFGDTNARDLEMVRLKFLAQDLERLKEKKPQLLKRFRIRVRQAGQNSSYYGFRFEVKMASMLLKDRFDFTMPDPPDFAIETKFGTAFIECGSSRLHKEKAGELWYKVEAELREKGAKPYANCRTALAMDITNLRFHGMGMDHPAAMVDLKPRLAEALNKTPLGSVLLYAYLYDRVDQRYHATYTRVDAEAAAPSLMSILEILAPATGITIKLPGVGKEG